MHKSLSLAVAFILSTLGTTLYAKEAKTVQLHPAGPWQLDAAEEKCRLAIRLDGDDKEHFLIMDLDKPSANVDFAIAGPALDGIDWDEPIAFAFGSLEPVVEERYSRGSLGVLKPALLTVATSLAEPIADEADEDPGELELRTENFGGLQLIPADRYEGQDALSIIQESREIVTMRLPKLASAFRALNQCAENFIEHWGLDLAQHRTMQRGPVLTNYHRIVRRIASIYPSAALSRGEQGVVRVVLLVDKTGSVSECWQSNATSLDKLESPACREMRRGTFEPALDVDGKPMRSYFASKIRYLLP